MKKYPLLVYLLANLSLSVACDDESSGNQDDAGISDDSEAQTDDAEIEYEDESEDNVQIDDGETESEDESVDNVQTDDGDEVDLCESIECDPGFTCNEGQCLCTAGRDCEGVCGGTAIEDACGICGGDGTSCIEHDGGVQFVIPGYTDNGCGVDGCDDLYHPIDVIPHASHEIVNLEYLGHDPIQVNDILGRLQPCDLIRSENEQLGDFFTAPVTLESGDIISFCLDAEGEWGPGYNPERREFSIIGDFDGLPFTWEIDYWFTYGSGAEYICPENALVAGEDCCFVEDMQDIYDLETLTNLPACNSVEQIRCEADLGTYIESAGCCYWENYDERGHDFYFGEECHSTFPTSGSYAYQGTWSDWDDDRLSYEHENAFEFWLHPDERICIRMFDGNMRQYHNNDIFPGEYNIDARSTVRFMHNPDLFADWDRPGLYVDANSGTGCEAVCFGPNLDTTDKPTFISFSIDVSRAGYHQSSVNIEAWKSDVSEYLLCETVDIDTSDGHEGCRDWTGENLCIERKFVHEISEW